MDLKAIIQDYLTQAQMVNLATVHWNKPWVTPLYYASDTDMNLYWMSRKSRRHSEELRKNSHVAGSIVLPVVYGQKVRGLQFEGEARELSKDEEVAGRSIYTGKFWIVEDRATSTNEAQDDHACYQVRPSRFLLFDEINFPDNPTQVLEL